MRNDEAPKNQTGDSDDFFDRHDDVLLFRSSEPALLLAAPITHHPEYRRFTDPQALCDLPPRQARISQGYQLQEVDLAFAHRSS